MSVAEVAGAGLWYHVQGAGDPVTTLGGDIMAHDQFHFVFPALVRRHTVVSWDYRNTGASERLPPERLEVSLDRKVEDLRAVLDAAGIGRTHLWAVATGTQVAVVFAARYPERVGALIHSGGVAPTDGGARLLDALEEVHARCDWPDACEEMMRLFGTTPAFLDWTLGVYTRNADPSWLAQFACELRADVRAELRATTSPTTVMLGDQGPLGGGPSSPAWLQTSECRPDAELLVVEGGSGTYYMVDAAERAAALALEVFSRHPIG